MFKLLHRRRESIQILPFKYIKGFAKKQKELASNEEIISLTNEQKQTLMNIELSSNELN